MERLQMTSKRVVSNQVERFHVLQNNIVIGSLYTAVPFSGEKPIVICTDATHLRGLIVSGLARAVVFKKVIEDLEVMRCRYYSKTKDLV
jgi:hypothetical protein